MIHIFGQNADGRNYVISLTAEKFSVNFAHIFRMLREQKEQRQHEKQQREKQANAKQHET
ncbi:hypothetical protein B0G69_6609 [Paraburkholderia sp. RAU2J]|nr:hypothetical protein B0G69_6609 [Paraburkholderia sp. RAU2J]